jgi:hypothetical protein
LIAGDIEEIIWSKNFMEMMQEIVGDSSIGFESCEVHLEYGQLATITFKKYEWDDQVYFCELFGTIPFSDLVRMPEGVQAITLTCKLGEFTMGQVRFVPIDKDLFKFFDTLRGVKFWQPSELEVIE